MTETFVAGLVDLLKRSLDHRVGPLERKIAELEARPALSWAGTHQEGKSYAEGSLVTRRGALWLSTKANDALPGSGPGWRLIVKKGGYGEQ